MRVLLETTYGSITIELDMIKTRKTSENFLSYVRKGFYNDTIFHRVINKFMIQGGGFTEDMTQKPTSAPIKNEAENAPRNMKYTVAMARTNEAHSATSQFFINTQNNDFLNFTSDTPGYCVFGKVVEGTEVVDKIEQVKTTTKNMMYSDVPVMPIVITKATVL